MSDYRDLMSVLDENDTMTLYRLVNDIFDTVVLVSNEGEPDEQTYVLADMQGAWPASLDEIGEYEWALAQDIDW